MKVQRIWDADVYRDGGSYGFCFDSDDGHWYEFFLKTRAFESVRGASHHPPVIYLEWCNSGLEVKRLSWEEAKTFVKPLRYESARFNELVQIVMNEARSGKSENAARRT